MTTRKAIICGEYPFELLDGQGGHYKWVTKNLRALGYNAQCQRWLLANQELEGLTCFDPFGGLGILSTIVQNLLKPAHLAISEIDGDCLRQLTHAMLSYSRNTEITVVNAKDSLLEVVSQVYFLDWPGFTVFQYKDWEKQLNAVFSRSPRAVTWFDSSAVYLPTNKEKYSLLTGVTINNREDYRYAVSKFFWERQGYSVTRVADDPTSHMSYFIARAVPPAEIEQFTCPRDGDGFRFIDEEKA